MMKKILAFSGSLRAGSYNQKLVKIAEDGGLLNAEYTAKVNAIGWKLAGVWAYDRVRPAAMMASSLSIISFSISGFSLLTSFLSAGSSGRK